MDCGGHGKGRVSDRGGIMTRKVVGVLLAILVSLSCTTATAGDTISLAIMASDDRAVEEARYAALSRYISAREKKIEKVELKVAEDYRHATRLFVSGEVDGMFAGSFVAAVFIRKGIARPLMRPLLTDGTSSYRALVITRKGYAHFNGIGDLKGRTVAYCALASAGEVFVRALLGSEAEPEDFFTPVVTASHADAIKAVEDGKADYAIVKNLVWDEEKHLGLKAVGGDSAENPNMTLILNNDAYANWGVAVRKVLLRLEFDLAKDAELVKDAFGLRGFIDTPPSSFEHTFELLDKAGCDPESCEFSL
jgi:ABC-type phosphate/phosphonate transport system substrate-binding protein